MALNVAVLGASGIGKYHIREFLNQGCVVTSILGSSLESSKKTAQELENLYSIKISPYADIEELLRKEKVEAVSICTPPETHYDLTKKCLKANLHVFCEKPLIADLPMLKRAKELVDLSEKKNLSFAVNTQWPSILKFLEYDSKLKSFEMSMQPGIEGRDMLLDHLPHTNSMLIRLCGAGEAKKIKFYTSKEKIVLDFIYCSFHEDVKVRYLFKFKKERPREVSFKINEKEFTRVVGTGYSQHILSEGKLIAIEDPLKLSILSFIQSIESTHSDLSNKNNLLMNVKLQEEILREYDRSREN